MKPSWQYKDIIDLEYFLHRDSDRSSKELHKRDRDNFLSKEKQQDAGKESDRRKMIRLWVEERVKTEFQSSESKSPGAIYRDTHLLAKNISVLKGIIFGLLAGLTFFAYTGTTPINVFHFLTLFVFSQVLLVAVLLSAYLLRRFNPDIRLPSFYSLLFKTLLKRITTFFHKQWLKNIDAEKRLSVGHAFGVIKTRTSLYGSLFYWPLFGLSQLIAIGFNLGLLLVTLFKIFTSDLAFGWQSTLQFSSDALYQAVKVIALPWSWFIAESHPTLTEIEGSRIILKEGIYHLATADLIAWWPFLVLCLFFYGLFLRFGMLLLGKWVEKKALANLRFDSPACLSLTRRMLTPLVSTQAKPEPIRQDRSVARSKGSAKPPRPTNHLHPLIVLVPDDVFDNCADAELAGLLKLRGLEPSTVHRFMVDYEEDQKLKEMLSTKDWQKNEETFILMEGWMPPLVDFLTFLKDLRAIVPKNSIIHLALVGRPVETIFTKVEPKDLTVWQHKVEAVGDPYLSIFSLIS